MDRPAMVFPVRYRGGAALRAWGGRDRHRLHRWCFCRPLEREPGVFVHYDPAEEAEAGWDLHEVTFRNHPWRASARLPANRPDTALGWWWREQHIVPTPSFFEER